MACMMKLAFLVGQFTGDCICHYSPKKPAIKSIQKAILSDKEREGITGSNNTADKEKFVLLNKGKYEILVSF